jgi:hypothetical protein
MDFGRMSFIARAIAGLLRCRPPSCAGAYGSEPHSGWSAADILGLSISYEADM